MLGWLACLLFVYTCCPVSHVSTVSFEFISKRRDPVSRNKRLRGGQSLSAITAALKEDDDDSDDEMVDLNGEETDNPKWQLYLAVKTASNAQGRPN